MAEDAEPLSIPCPPSPVLKSTERDDIAEDTEPLPIPCPPSPVLGSALSGVIVEKKIVQEEDAGLRPRRFKPPDAFEAAMQGEEDIPVCIHAWFCT